MSAGNAMLRHAALPSVDDVAGFATVLVKCFLVLCAARNLCGAVYVDDLNFPIWQDPDDGDIPFALDLDRSALRIVLTHQVMFTVADFSDFGFFHEICLLCFLLPPIYRKWAVVWGFGEKWKDSE